MTVGSKVIRSGALPARRGAPCCIVLLLAVLLTVLPGPAPAHGAVALPPNFDDRLVTDLFRPSALAFTPDGRLLIASTLGTMHVYENGALRPAPALDISSKVCFDNERGLLGLAVDPSFETNHYVFAYYTFKKYGVCEMNTANSPVNRVSRFVLGANNVIDPASEVILVDNIPSTDGRHNAGDLHFGKDDYLYVSVGDGYCDYAGNSGCANLNDASRDQNVLLGKILRITRDGDIPPGNPFTGTQAARCNVTGVIQSNRKCQETFAWGLRNPWRIAFDPNASGTRFFINDVGESHWEEIDLGVSGADYGWNVREGPCARDSYTNCGPPPVGMTNPIFSYDHTAGCSSVTGGAFVPLGAWPAQYDDVYLHGDFTCGKIFALKPSGGSYSESEFATGLGVNSMTGMIFGPDGAGQSLYYMTWASSPTEGHQVRKISFTGTANRSPTAGITADPTYGALPLDVNFNGTSSTDPDGDPLTFEWDFGDGSPHGSGATTTHRYTSAGTYSATVIVRDNRGGQDSRSIRIDAGNTPPIPQIDSPAPGARFSVGEQVTLTGSATDAQEGQLADSRLTWTVERHHDTHMHPFLPPTSGNDIPIVGPQPEDLTATNTSYLEILLTATDSNGLSRTISQDFRPKLVDLTFASDPPGLHVDVNEVEMTGPQTVTSWEAWQLTLSAQEQTDATGQLWRFYSWSDGGTASHAITTPAAATTYTAKFTHGYPRPKGATPMYASLVPAYAACTTPNRLHGPPLAYQSCSDPVRTSQHLTVGTPDANGAASSFIGVVRLDVILDASGTPQDETDLQVRTSAEDVRNAGSLSDYAGELTAALPVRLTDKANGVSPDDWGTVSDTELSLPFQCSPTADEGVGASCSLTTTLRAVIPGIATKGRRAIWQLRQIGLYDGGADGLASTHDNTLFATQGIFVP
jgi:glucose/arabinose dehydrogenase